VSQDFERFEQGRLQNASLPGGLLYDRLEQAPLLGRGLLQEQLARPTRQAQHVDGLTNGRWRALLDVVDLA